MWMVEKRIYRESDKDQTSYHHKQEYWCGVLYRPWLSDPEYETKPYDSDIKAYD